MDKPIPTNMISFILVSVHNNLIFHSGFGTEALCLFSLSFIYNGGVAVAMLSVGVSMGGLAVSGELKHTM